MKGDFTRTTFDPDKRYSSVRMQQGRVQVDADWNEQVDIEEYLRETALVDIIGPCGAPCAEEDSGFKIELADGGTNLTFSAGRFYCHGVLCENDATRRLTEQDEEQPGFTLPAANAGTWIVYLDSWQRHLTALQDPSIREVALGGPDTATRTRTMAQVKMVEVPSGTECPDEPQAWLDTIAAPTGRMTARTRPADFDPNPCAVPPASGYTRLENQLYRVEVHRGGELGGPGPQPTFKWSRDNGSIVSRWLTTAGSTVTVDSLGRDEILTLEGARWIELTDDLDELAGEPGELFETSAFGENTLTVVGAPGAPNLDRNARVRRWDMPGAGGAVPIVQAPDDNSWTNLEAGIQIDFAPGTYRTGDYWLIPARAFIGELAGDIEWPEDGGGNPLALPPEGIEHCYCKLAVVEKAGDLFSEPEDCRELFCPITEIEDEPGCCTVVVPPGDDIQAALDSLPAEGGCVCLKTGVHPVRVPIRIEGSNITLHGESPGAVVRSAETVTLLEVGPVADRLRAVHVEGIRFVYDGPPAANQGLDPIVSFESVEQSALAHCWVRSESLVWSAVRIGRCEEVAVEGCRLSGTSVGIHVDTDSTALVLRDNGVAITPAAGTDGDSGFIGIWLEDAFGASRIEDNSIEGYVVGIALNRNLFAQPSGGAHGSRIEGNRIVRSQPGGGGLETHLFGIDVAALSCRVRGNRLTYGSTAYGGIRVSSADGRIEENGLLSSLGPTQSQMLPVGIVVGWEVEDVPGLGDRAAVVGNRLVGTQDAIWVAGSDDVTVADNHVGLAGDPVRIGVGLNGCRRTRVVGNRIRNAVAAVLAGDGEANRIEDNRVEEGTGGIGAISERDFAVSRNEVENLTANGIGGLNLTGSTVVSSNRIVSCVHAPGVFAPYAIVLVSQDTAGSALVESNVVIDSGVSVDGDLTIDGARGIGIAGRAATVHGNRVYYENLEAMGQGALAEGRALFVFGLLRIEGSIDLGNVSLPAEFFFHPAQISVTDNSFHGVGASALVEVVHFSHQVNDRFILELGFGEVTFSANHCLHIHGPAGDGGDTSDQFPEPCTVALGGRRAIVIGNHVRSFDGFRSFDFTQAGSVIYTGNFTTGGTVHSNNFPAPESGHNRS